MSTTARSTLSSLQPLSAAIAAHRAAVVDCDQTSPAAVNADLTAKPRRRRRSTRVLEATDYAAMMRRMIRAHGRRVADCDIEDLADLIGLQELLDATIAGTVATMRERHGWSWADIARATGVSKQAAAQRWGHRRAS